MQGVIRYFLPKQRTAEGGTWDARLDSFEKRVSVYTLYTLEPERLTANQHQLSLQRPGSLPHRQHIGTQTSATRPVWKDVVWFTAGIPSGHKTVLRAGKRPAHTPPS